MGKIVVIGSSNTDMVITSAKMPLPGETVMGNEFDIIAGGKGANQAVAAARAGGDVSFIAKVGNDDFGKKAIEGYDKDNIDTKNIFIDKEKSTGVAVIIVDETTAQNSIIVAPGSNANLSVNDIQKVKQVISEADILLVQLEIPIKTVQVALQIARENGVKTILNPAPAQQLSNELLNLVDIITPNETETKLLIGIDPTNDNDIRDAASKLLKKVKEAVLITLGSKGVYYLSNNGDEAFVPAIKVDAVDTTAAGDVFNGYFATGLATGKSFEEAIGFANKAAAFSVTQKGAQPSIPKKSDL
ncbi:MAG: ribokinase [Draconibacterium sp.]|nr:ribokinase [Draconibacterium sp.]